MGKLIRYLDGQTGCWSRVNLANGDPIWISVAQSGVMVKKSQMGFIGAKLYNETNVYNAAKTAKALDKEIGQYTTPTEMTNLVLRTFTQVALESNTAAEFSVRLNRHLESESANDSIVDENRQKAERVEQVIRDYGDFIEHHPAAGEIRDVSELPHSKEEILDAITLGIVRENDEKIIGALKVAAIRLADFQVNVGPKPLTMLGISNSDMLAGAAGGHDKLKELAARIANNPDKEKYESFSKIVEQELAEIQNKLMAAEELRRPPPAKGNPKN